MRTSLITFLMALIGSISLTPLVRRLAFRFGIIDQPGPRKMHLTPMPLLGGLAMYAGVILAVVLSFRGSARLEVGGILAAATLLVIVGILDERRLLHHQVKLFVAMPMAAVILLASGIRLQLFSSLLAAPAAYYLDTTLTLFWVVGITSAFSILDHMDGLCTGIASLASCFFLLLAVTTGQYLVGSLAAAILGASLGFLYWNFNPAKIFMGDGGAMFLGFMMAALGLKLRLPQQSQLGSWTTAILILGVPIFDTLLVSISRGRRGLVPFTSPGKDHTAHRLANLGLGHRGAVLTLYAVGCVFGAMAVAASLMPLPNVYVLAAALAMGAIPAVAWLERAPYERQQKQ